MFKVYPRFKKGEVENIYKNIPNPEKKKIEEYLTYRKARGLNSLEKLKDVKREIIQLRYIFGKNFKKITLKEYRELLSLVNSSYLTNSSKNQIKVDLKNFLKFLFPDWSMKFYGFEDIKLDNERNEEKINSHTIFSRKDVENLISHEPKLFWKTFLILQYEGGLRTIEVRTLEWEKIRFNVDGDISEIGVYSTKTGKGRSVFVKQATNFLMRLKEEQEIEGTKGIYVFNSRKNKNQPVNKAMVSVWFRRLSKRVLGREGWSYLFRHSRATELYRLAEDNKISKDIAIKFLGHSKDMSNTYTHLDKEDVKKMLKNQVYKEQELTKEERREMERLREQVLEIKKEWDSFKDKMKELERLEKEQGKKKN